MVYLNGYYLIHDPQTLQIVCISSFCFFTILGIAFFPVSGKHVLQTEYDK